VRRLGTIVARTCPCPTDTHALAREVAVGSQRMKSVLVAYILWFFCGAYAQPTCTHSELRRVTTHVTGARTRASARARSVTLGRPAGRAPLLPRLAVAGHTVLFHVWPVLNWVGGGFLPDPRPRRRVQRAARAYRGGDGRRRAPGPPHHRRVPASAVALCAVPTAGLPAHRLQPGPAPRPAFLLETCATPGHDRMRVPRVWVWVGALAACVWCACVFCALALYMDPPSDALTHTQSHRHTHRHTQTHTDTHRHLDTRVQAGTLTESSLGWACGRARWSLAVCVRPNRQT
jgi:hypothetical protein